MSQGEPPPVCSHTTRSRRVALHVDRVDDRAESLELLATAWPLRATLDGDAEVRFLCDEQAWGPWIEADVESGEHQQLGLAAKWKDLCEHAQSVASKRGRVGVKLTRLCVGSACEMFIFEVAYDGDQVVLAPAIQP